MIFVRILLFLIPFPLLATLPEVSLKSLYLFPPVEEAHRIQIQGELGGEAILILDPNVCILDLFGDTTICTQMYPSHIDIWMKPLRIADPLGLGRMIYRLEGSFPNPDNAYYLITPSKEGSVFRLIIENRYEDMKQVISLEEPLN